MSVPPFIRQCRPWYCLMQKNGRSGEIRTPGPLVPNQMRYQAALHSDTACFTPTCPHNSTLKSPQQGKKLPALLFKLRQGGHQRFWQLQHRALPQILCLCLSGVQFDHISGRLDRGQSPHRKRRCVFIR